MLLILGCSFVAVLNFPIVWSRASLDAVSDPSVIAELRDQLLAQEWELVHREKLLLDPRARRAGGRALSQESAHGI
jgi:hypothetical protein